MPEEPLAPDAEDKPDAPEDASPDKGTSANEDSFTESYKPDDLPEEARAAYEDAYKKMQADYTSKTQTISEQRQEAEQAMALVQALQDPDYQAQALQALGLEFADEEAGDDEGDDDLLPEEKLAERLDALEGYLAESDQRAEQEAYEDAEDEFILGKIETLSKDQGQFTEEEVALLYTHALANRKADGEPDVANAYEALKAAETAAHERHLKSKQAEQLGVGTAGDKKIDLNDDDARQQLMRDIMDSEGAVPNT